MTENDCESKAHGIVALYLAIKQCSKKTVQATREYVWTNVMQIKGGVSSMPKFGNTAALSSLDAFVDHMDTHYNSPNTPVEGSAESMLDAITTVVMWMSKYGAVHHNLGLAYAANPMQKMTPEALAARRPGGKLFPPNHEYLMQEQLVRDSLTIIPLHFVSRPLICPVHREGPCILGGDQGNFGTG